MKITIDTREPWPHPWAAYFSEDVHVERGTMETGDLCVSALPDGAICERKTKTDYLAAIGSQRERFQRELARSRYCGAFCIVVEASFGEVLAAGRAMSHHAIIGTTASWSRRFGPIVFCDTQALAAEFAERFLRSQIREVERAAKALKAEATA
jgi:ERCC4-type nuclease